MIFDPSNLVVIKTVFEIRYPAAALLFDRRGHIATEFQRDLFTEWRITHNRVELHDQDRTLLAFAAFKNCGMAMEQYPGLQFFLTHTRRFLRLVLEQLEVERLTRIGLRHFCFIPLEGSFSSAVDYFTSAFYSFSESQVEALGGSFRDVGMTLELKIEDMLGRLTLGPMQAEQYGDMRILESEKDREALPETSMFLDFDLYRINPETPRNLVEFCREFITRGDAQIHDRIAAFLQDSGE